MHYFGGNYHYYNLHVTHKIDYWHKACHTISDNFQKKITF
jgi:hypothetical protein